jgi:hypothetical protein
MSENKKNGKKSTIQKRIRLMCKELEEATNRFLAKIAELEKLLSKVDE